MESTTLFNYFDELFRLLFFQDDDNVGSKAFVDNFAKDLSASINTQHLDYDAFQKACIVARRNWTMSLQSHEPLVTSFEDAQSERYPHDVGPNAVATKSFWTFVEKATEKKTRRETVIIIITRLEDDMRRRVTQWTEVTRDLEE